MSYLTQIELKLLHHACLTVNFKTYHSVFDLRLYLTDFTFMNIYLHFAQYQRTN